MLELGTPIEINTTADLRWIDPPQKIGFRTKPPICGFFLLLRNIFT